MGSASSKALKKNDFNESEDGDDEDDIDGDHSTITRIPDEVKPRLKIGGFFTFFSD